jgi:hypothetical protein
MTWLTCSSGPWPSCLYDSSSAGIVMFLFVLSPGHRRANLVAHEGSEEPSKIAGFTVHEHHRMAIGSWVLRLAIKGAMRLWVCMRVFPHSGSFCWWQTSLHGQNSRLRLRGQHLCGIATVLWWMPLRQEHMGSGGLHAHCGWTVRPRSVLERETFTFEVCMP